MKISCCSLRGETKGKREEKDGVRRKREKAFSLGRRSQGENLRVCGRQISGKGKRAMKEER